MLPVLTHGAKVTLAAFKLAVNVILAIFYLMNRPLIGVVTHFMGTDNGLYSPVACSFLLFLQVLVFAFGYHVTVTERNRKNPPRVSAIIQATLWAMMFGIFIPAKTLYN